MAQGYTPVWDDWLEVTRELNAQEKGRLIDAIVAYKLHGDWQEQIKGNERYVFPTYQVRLDRWAEVTDGRARAGASGGNQTQANGSKTKQTEANASKSPKVKVEVKEEDIDDDDTARVRETSFGPVEVDPVIIAVQQELTGLSLSHYDDLAEFRKLIPDELVIEAVNEAVAHGARTWAYVRTILQGYIKDGIRTVGDARNRSERRKQRDDSTKRVSAQQYTQRDYTEDELEARIRKI